MAQLLLIEDDEEARAAMAFALRRAGHDVTTLADGRKAVDVCRERGVDVVVTDIVMPNAEGIGAIRALREALPDIGIIAISGGGSYGNSENYLTAARKLGADHALAKPFAPARLLEAISDLIESDEG